MLINKDTEIYCSFSSNPGNNGCNFFNDKFVSNNINAIYKSFYSEDIDNNLLVLGAAGDVNNEWEMLDKDYTELAKSRGCTSYEFRALKGSKIYRCR